MTEATTQDVVRRQWPPYGPGSTRLLVLGWCLWLLGAWLVTLWNDSPVPSTRWMVFSALIGLMAIWPVWRLSQSEGFVPGGGRWNAIGQTLLDWVCLVAVLQVVIWPLQLTAGWSLSQAVWLDAAIAAWSGLTGLVIAWGRGWPGPGRRTLAAGLCLGLVLVEPALMLLIGGDWAWRVSPIETVWALCSPPTRFRLEPWASHVTATAVAAAVGWLGIGLWAALFAKRV